MEEENVKEYNTSYQKYKSLSKEEKILKYKLMQIQLQDLKDNRTKVLETNDNVVASVTFGSITILIAIMNVPKSIMDEPTQSIYSFIMFLIILGLAVSALYIMSKNKGIRKNTIINFKNEREEINRLRVQSQSIKDLLLNDDNYGKSVVMPDQQ